MPPAITQECCEQYWKSPGGNTPQNSSCTTTYHPSQKLSKLDKLDMRDTAGEVRTYSCGPLHTNEQRQNDQLEPIYNSSVLIQDIALKTSRKQWTIETGGERVSGRSVLAAWHDDDEIDNIVVQRSEHQKNCYHKVHTKRTVTPNCSQKELST